MPERQKLEQMIKELSENGRIEEEKDYSGGYSQKDSQSDCENRIAMG